VLSSAIHLEHNAVSYKVEGGGTRTDTSTAMFHGSPGTPRDFGAPRTPAAVFPGLGIPGAPPMGHGSGTPVAHGTATGARL